MNGLAHAAKVTYELPLLEKVKIALTKGTTAETKQHLLYQAACEGSTEATRLILASGVDLASMVTSITHASETPLMRAAFNGHAEIVSLLLTHEKSGNLVKQIDGRTGATALHCAVAKASIESSKVEDYLIIIKNLLKHGAKIDAQDNSGLTALQYVCIKSAKSALINALIDAGADTSIICQAKTAYDFLKARLETAKDYVPSAGQKAVLSRLQIARKLSDHHAVVSTLTVMQPEITWMIELGA